MPEEDFINLNQFYDDEEDSWEESSKSVLSKAESDFVRYENPELIATGGMKEIYKVYDSKNRRHVALAKLRADVPEEQCEDFFKEAYLTAALEHPNIISLYDIGVDSNGTPFFSMELKVGDSLGEIIRQRAQGSEKYLQEYFLHKLLDIFIKVCDAVSYAHSADILHLDLKPDNIQVGKFGDVQVCDWGLGSNIEDANKNGDENYIKGTPGYMPPEQIMQELGKDCTTDIFALGALLFTLLTDKGPVEGGFNTIIKKTLDGELATPVEKHPDKNIPESLNAVVCKAMSNEKNERYASVEDLRAEVEKYLSGHSTSAENAGFIKEFKLFYKRNKAICLVAAVSFLVILISSSVFILKIQKSRYDLQDANLKVRDALAESNKNYELYKDKVVTEQKLTFDLLEDAFQDALLKIKNPLFFSNPLKYTDEALVTFKKHYQVTGKSPIIRHIVAGLIISQRYEEVKNYSKLGDPELIKLAEEFSGLSRGKTGQLLDEDFLRLLKRINELSQENREKLMERIVVYQLSLSKWTFGKNYVLAYILKCWNPGWDKNELSYNPKELILKLGGKNLRVLKGKGSGSSELCFLRFIKANHLNLKGTGISSLRELNGFTVRALDLRGTEVTSLRLVRGMPNLNRLVIGIEQFNEKELGRLPPSVKHEEK